MWLSLLSSKWQHFEKKEQKTGFQRWQIRPFLENCHKPPDFDKVLWPNHFSYRHYRGKTISISFIWHLVFWNLPGGTPVMTSWKKWPHLGISDIKKFFPIFTKIFSTSGKIFQPQLFWHQNISTCPSFFCYDEIIFQITNFWIKRLLIRPKLFRHTTWIGLIYIRFRTKLAVLLRRITIQNNEAEIKSCL